MRRLRSHSETVLLQMLLVAMALLLRALVPTGWMPAEDGSGIRPCLPWAMASTHAPGASGTQSDHGAHHQRHHDSHHGGHHATDAVAPDHDNAPGHRAWTDQPCSFAALGAPLAQATAVELPLPAPTAQAPQEPPPHAGRPAIPPLAAPPPPQTGPPALT